MSLFTFVRKQHLHISIDEAWEFFSDPLNLKLITPPEMDLKITSENDKEIHPGMIITYELNVIPLIKSVWATEITHVEKPYFFVDEQKVGPYSFWHHKHYFTESENGTITSDLVHYSLPMGPLGNILNSLYVRKKLEYIFNYRRGVLDGMFSSKI